MPNADSLANPRDVEAHLGLVHHIAQQLEKTLNLQPDLEYDEIVSAGTLGLMEAMERYDESRGLSFSTFAAPRIRGAILDEIRSTDTATRSLRKKQKLLRRTRQVLGLDLIPATVADVLAMPEDTVARWIDEVETLRVLSLTGPDDEHAEPLQSRIADPRDGPDRHTNRTIDAVHVHRAIEGARLTDQERTVVNLFYFEGQKANQIATLLGVTEARISQVRAKAHAKLRLWLLADAERATSR